MENSREKVKVLFVHFNSELSGSDLSLYYLVKWLNREEYTPIVVLPSEGPLVHKYRGMEVKVIFTPMTKISRNPLSMLKYVLRFPIELILMIRVLKQEDPTLIHTNDLPNMHGPFAAKILGLKHIQHIRKYELRPRFIYYLLTFLAVSLSDKTIAVSKANIGNLPKFIKRTADIDVVYNGVDFEVFDKTKYCSTKRRFNMPEEKTIIGNISNFGYFKGQEILVEIAPSLLRQYRNLIFVFMGDKKSKDYYRLIELIKEKGLEDKIAVFDNIDNVPEVLSLIDIFVFPSLRESFPRVIIEAMAMGKAIVSNDVGGVNEAIENGHSGILVKPNNKVELEEAILRLLSNRDYAKEIGENAYKECKQNFSAENTTRKIVRIYEEVIGAQR